VRRPTIKSVARSLAARWRTVRWVGNPPTCTLKSIQKDRALPLFGALRVPKPANTPSETPRSPSQSLSSTLHRGIPPRSLTVRLPAVRTGMRKRISLPLGKPTDNTRYRLNRPDSPFYITGNLGITASKRWRPPTTRLLDPF